MLASQEEIFLGLLYYLDVDIFHRVHLFEQVFVHITQLIHRICHVF